MAKASSLPRRGSRSHAEFAAGRTAASLARIVSGGQTGVDRAALDFALAHGIPYGGWCPRGGWAEDHPVPPGLLASYPELRETPSADPAQRTRWNVRDCDATVVLATGAAAKIWRADSEVASPGTTLTETIAAELGRPLLRVGALDPVASRASLAELLAALPRRCVLNVAGPRESEMPGAYARSMQLLGMLFG